MSAPDLTIKLGDVELKNPVLTASGTCGYGPEYSAFADLAAINVVDVAHCRPLMSG